MVARSVPKMTCALPASGDMIIWPTQALEKYQCARMPREVGQAWEPPNCASDGVQSSCPRQPLRWPTSQRTSPGCPMEPCAEQLSTGLSIDQRR